MWRRLRQLLILLCLLLAIATAGLWVRSGWRGDGVEHQHSVLTAADGAAASVRKFGVASARGRILLWVVHGDYSGYPPGYFSVSLAHNGWDFDGFQVGLWAPLEGALGFGIESDPGTLSAGDLPGEINRRTETTLQFPHWFLVLLLSIPPAVAAVRRWRRRRVLRAMGVDAVPCPACGYDCRATPGRCPECGQAPAAA